MGRDPLAVKLIMPAGCEGAPEDVLIALRRDVQAGRSSVRFRGARTDTGATGLGRLWDNRFGWKAAGPLSDVNAEKQTSPSRAFPTLRQGSKSLLAGNLIRRCDQI
jgi:hypothetical protein